jgi:hypothetical protein
MSTEAKFVTIRDAADNKFQFTCYSTMLAQFRKALVQKSCAALLGDLNRASVPPAIWEDAAAADDDAVATCLYYYAMRQINMVSGAGVEVVAVSKNDHEDWYAKKLDILKLTFGVCKGADAVVAQVGGGGRLAHRAVTILPLDALHAILAELDEKKVAKKALANLSERKVAVGEDCDGSWRIACDAVHEAGAPTAKLDLVFTVKTRSDEVPLVGSVTTKLPPLPEEEDDIALPVKLSEPVYTSGHVGPAPLPRDPAAMQLPADKAEGALLAVRGPIEPAHSVDAPPKAAGSKLKLDPAAVACNQAFSARDGKFSHWFYMKMHARCLSKRCISALTQKGASAEWQDADGKWVAAKSVVVGQDYGRGQYDFDEAGRDMIVWHDEALVVRVEVEVEGKPGQTNMQRALCHGSFPQPLCLRATLEEAKAEEQPDVEDNAESDADAVALSADGVKHTVHMQQANPPVKIEDAASLADSWGCKEQGLLLFAHADVAQDTVRHAAGVYVAADGLVVRRTGYYATLDLDAFNQNAYEATKKGLAEVEIEGFSCRENDAEFKAFVLVDTAYPPMAYGVRLEITTAVSSTVKSCHLQLQGDGWWAARQASSVAESAPAKSSSADDTPATGSAAAGDESDAGKAPPSAASSGAPSDPSSILSGMGEPQLTSDTVASANSASLITVLYNEKLGSGAYGDVYRAFHNGLGKFVAIKIARISADPVLRQSLVHEFTTLTKLDSDSIVRVLALELAESTVRIVMEWMPAGSVSSILRNTRHRLHESVIRRFLTDALKGLAYLHERGVVHLDIKPANMLVGADGAVKLADFGTCKLLRNGGSLTTQSVVGTPAYMPPEMITSGKYYNGSDMWALACSAVEMATNAMPWSHLDRDVRDNVYPLMFHIGNAKVPAHAPLTPGNCAHLSKDLRRILEACFVPTIASRPTAAKLLQDEYFANAGLPLDAESDADFQKHVVARANDTAAELRGTNEQGAASTLSSVLVSGDGFYGDRANNATVGSNASAANSVQ